MAKLPTPKAIFNTIEDLHRQTELTLMPDEEYRVPYASSDYRLARGFLLAYQKNHDTFRAYRGDIERLLQWSWLIKQQSILAHRRQDIEELLTFCLNPPLSWISNQLRPRFLKQPGGDLVRNPKWRPFVHCTAKDSKRVLTRGLHSDHYQPSEAAIKIMLAAWGSFYNYLIQEEIASMNPVALIKQKSTIIHLRQQHRPIRRLSNQQLSYVMKAAELMATENPRVHNRTLFIIEALFGMYLRISELVSSQRWTPMMNHFFEDHDGNWWFKVLDKGNKEGIG